MAKDVQVELVHVRLPKDMVRRIDHLAVDEDLYRQGAIEKLLAYALAAAGQSGRIPEPDMA